MCSYFVSVINFTWESLINYSTTDPEAVRPICTISTSNIIAFTSFTELSDADGDTWGGHVYVCDINTPWNSYKVTSTMHPVSIYLLLEKRDCFGCLVDQDKEYCLC